MTIKNDASAVSLTGGNAVTITIEHVTWFQLQQVDQLLLSAKDLAGYESVRWMINRAVGGDRAAKERCVAILNAYLAPEAAS